MRSARRITVLVDQIAIADGQIDPPEVGEIAAFPLRFEESATDAPDVHTVRGVLEPSSRGPTRWHDHWRWHGLLRGDGWTASWSGPQPLAGQVELTGQFMGVMDIDAIGEVRGRVLSVQVASVTWERVDTRLRWALTSDVREYRTIERSPRFFADERLSDVPPDPARAEIGVVIGLDLDDVPELPSDPIWSQGTSVPRGRDCGCSTARCRGSSSAKTAHAQRISFRERC